MQCGAAAVFRRRAREWRRSSGAAYPRPLIFYELLYCSKVLNVTFCIMYRKSHAMTLFSPVDELHAQAPCTPCPALPHFPFSRYVAPCIQKNRFTAAAALPVPWERIKVLAANHADTASNAFRGQSDGTRQQGAVLVARGAPNACCGSCTPLAREPRIIRRRPTRTLLRRAQGAG
jgi:hypothetical protein